MKFTKWLFLAVFTNVMLYCAFAISSGTFDFKLWVDFQTGIYAIFEIALTGLLSMTLIMDVENGHR